MNYAAPWWLPGGNLQTIWAALFARRGAEGPPSYRRERWDTPDGDFVDLDWLEGSAPTLGTSCPARCLAGRDLPEASSLSPVHARSSGHGAAGSSPSGVRLAGGGPALRPAPTLVTSCTAPADRPLLVLFHGLEGSSRSHYAEAFAGFARDRRLGFVVPHFRGCGGDMNLGPRAYHSGDHEEIGWVLARLRQRHRGPLLAVGVSLGGNALMRWAGEAGEQAGRFADAVASVCAPLDLTAGGRAIGRGFNRLLYTTMFLRSLKPKALRKLAQHPGLFDREALLAARDLYEFDNVFTAPLHGFRNTDDYWTRASAKPHLHRIRIPALALNARNDPFVPAASLPAPQDCGRHVTLWQPPGGGHVGFPQGPWPGHVRQMPAEVGGWLLAAAGCSGR